MYHCERCGSSYSSVRAKYLTDCPRCLLRSDIASPLVHVEGPSRPRPRPDSHRGRRADRALTPSA
jgi:predicted  nucleic acid-binding Zn-ribbon protein